MTEWISLIVAAIIIVSAAVYFGGRTVLGKLGTVSRRRERPEQIEKAASVLDAMMRLLEQQRALSHEITDSLERKMNELRGLIREADETIARLAARASTFTAPQATPETEPEETDEGLEFDTGTGAEERAALFGSVRTVSPIKSPLPGSKLSAEEKQRLVYGYADAGMDIHEIAREMQIGKGEVKLILSLRQGR